MNEAFEQLGEDYCAYFKTAPNEACRYFAELCSIYFWQTGRANLDAQHMNRINLHRDALTETDEPNDGCCVCLNVTCRESTHDRYGCSKGAVGALKSW